MFIETHCFQLFWIYRELFIEYCWILTLLRSVSGQFIPLWAEWVSSTRLISRAGLCTVFSKDLCLLLCLLEESLSHLPSHSSPYVSLFAESLCTYILYILFLAVCVNKTVQVAMPLCLSSVWISEMRVDTEGLKFCEKSAMCLCMCVKLGVRTQYDFCCLTSSQMVFSLRKLSGNRWRSYGCRSHCVRATVSRATCY